MTITRRQVLATGAAALGAGLLPAGARAQGATATLAFGPATPVYALGHDRRGQGLLQGGEPRLQAGGRQRGHTRAPGARGRAGRVRARRRQPSAPALRARQEVQDRHGDADDRLDLQHRGAEGPLRRRHHHRREARGLQAPRRRQADHRRDGHRVRAPGCTAPTCSSRRSSATGSTGWPAVARRRCSRASRRSSSTPSWRCPAG